MKTRRKFVLNQTTTLVEEVLELEVNVKFSMRSFQEQRDRHSVCVIPYTKIFRD
jgi:hypothetical protein